MKHHQNDLMSAAAANQVFAQEIGMKSVPKFLATPTLRDAKRLRRSMRRAMRKNPAKTEAMVKQHRMEAAAAKRAANPALKKRTIGKPKKEG